MQYSLGDLSLGGAFIKTRSSTPSVGARLELALPDTQVAVKAQVAHVRNGNTKKDERGFGVRFCGLGNSTVRSISQLLTQDFAPSTC